MIQPPTPDEITRFVRNGDFFLDDKNVELLYVEVKPRKSLIVYASPVRQTLTDKVPPEKAVSLKESLAVHERFLEFMKNHGSPLDEEDYHPRNEWRVDEYDNGEMLKHWSDLTKSLNSRGYSVRLFTVRGYMKHDEIVSYVTDKLYVEMFIGLTIDPELVKQHKGKIGARSMGLIESKNSLESISGSMYDLVDKNFPDTFVGNTMHLRSSSKDRALFDIKIGFDEEGNEPELFSMSITRDHSKFEKINYKKLERMCIEYDDDEGEGGFYNISGDAYLGSYELLKTLNGWKNLVKQVETHGFRMKVVLLSERMQSMLRVFIFLERDPELAKKHKGKIMGRSLGLVESKIFLNFEDFLFESSGEAASDLLRTLARNYESKKFFYTDDLQFNVEEERRDWREARKYVELEKTVNHDATYTLKFNLDNNNYALTIDFNFSFKGKKEKDAPENISPAEANRLNVVLTGIDVKKIVFSSSNLNFSTSSPVGTVKDAAVAFLQKMMSPEYDSLGPELYNLQQK
jgi:hypothetical protein